MLLDRLDWVDGWPAVRAGQGPSERSEQAPVTGGRVATTFSRGDGGRLSTTGRWTRAQDAQSGTLPAIRPGGRRPHSVLGHRGRAGRGRPAFLRRGIRAGRVRPRQGRDPARDRPRGPARQRCARTATGPPPARFGCRRLRRRRLALRRRSSAVEHGVTAQLSNARLGDPLVDLRITLSPKAARAGRAGATGAGAGVGVDNLSVLPAAVPVTRLAAEHVPITARPGRQRRVQRHRRSPPRGSGCARRQGHRRRRRAALADRGRGPDRRPPTTRGSCCGTRVPARGPRRPRSASTSAPTRSATSSRRGSSPT